MGKCGFVQVGFTALRNPQTGEFLPAVPLYIQADSSAIDAERQIVEDIGGLLAKRMKSYREGCRKAGATL